MGWNIPRLTHRAYLNDPAVGSGPALRSRFNILQSQSAADARVGLESRHRIRTFRSSPRKRQAAHRHRDGQLPAVTARAVSVASYPPGYDFMNGGFDAHPRQQGGSL